MDVLKYVPLEIWRHIFRHITASQRPNDEDPSSHPVMLFGTDPHEEDAMAIARQHQRAELILICRFLAPLAEELLYSEAHLLEPDALQQFLTQARTPGFGRVPRGWWTWRVDVDSSHLIHGYRKSQFDRYGNDYNIVHHPTHWDPANTAGPVNVLPNHLFVLNEACPNISRLHLKYGWTPEFDSPGRPRLANHPHPVFKNVRMLSIGDFYYDEALKKSCPHLPSFPQLEYLQPPTRFIHQIRTKLLGMLQPLAHAAKMATSEYFIDTMMMAEASKTFQPRLRWLSINLGNPTKLDNVAGFCHRYGSALVVLELTQVGFNPCGQIGLASPQFLRHVPALEMLILLEEIHFEDIPLGLPHKSLRSLILRIREKLVEDVNLAPHRAFFKRTCFPSLEKVEVVQGAAGRRHRLSMVEADWDGELPERAKV